MVWTCRQALGGRRIARLWEGAALAALVILIYFIHPLLVGFMVILMGQERLTVISLGALVAALVGLGLAIGFSLGNPSPAGIGLATMAMAMAALVVVGNARAVREAPALSVGFYMLLSAAATLGRSSYLLERLPSRPRRSDGPGSSVSPSLRPSGLSPFLGACRPSARRARR
jgi:hypothetical protein